MNGLLKVVGRARFVAAAALLGAFAAVGVGCGEPGLGTYNVTVQLDESLRTAPTVPTIPVAFVALSGSEADRMAEKSVVDYFADGDPDRQSLLNDGEEVSGRFSSREREDVKLSAKDPVWKTKWDGRDRLFVLADIPGASAKDRRREIPRQKDRWETRNIVIKLRRDRLELETQPNAVSN